MKLMTTALLAAFVLGTISPDVLAKGGRGSGGGKRSHASHASSGNYSGGSKAGDGTCHTGPRGGRYTITPSGHKNYSGC